METKHSLALVNLICENSFYKEICEELAIKRATNKAGQVDLLRKKKI